MLVWMSVFLLLLNVFTCFWKKNLFKHVCIIYLNLKRKFSSMFLFFCRRKSLSCSLKYSSLSNFIVLIRRNSIHKKCHCFPNNDHRLELQRVVHFVSNGTMNNMKFNLLLLNLPQRKSYIIPKVSNYFWYNVNGFHSDNIFEVLKAVASINF